jgi:hypothetical protein
LLRGGVGNSYRAADRFAYRRHYVTSTKSGDMLDPEIGRSLAMIRKNLFAGRREFLPVLLEAAQHGEIALVEHRTAVPMNIAGASSVLLFGSTMLRDRSIGQDKRQGADENDIPVHEKPFSR